MAAPSVAATPTAPDAFEPSPATAGQSIASLLDAAWAKDWLAPVTTRELAGAHQVLFDRLDADHVLDERYRGMQLLTGLGEGGVLEAQLSPTRNDRPVTLRTEGGVRHSDLSSQSLPEERGLLWRDYIVRPNIFPYVPKGSRHTLVATREVEPQHYDPRRLADMIDFQKAMGANAPVTLHYNGIASNSEFHWHWQATRETLPVQRLLDEGQLALDVLSRSSEGNLATFHQGFFTGLLVRGREDYVVRRATELVNQLNRDPLTLGAYNMLLLKPGAGGEVRLVIIPRRSLNLRPSSPDFGSISLGAMTLGGRLMLQRAQLPQGYVEQATAVAAKTVVVPSELNWLERLRDARPRVTSNLGFEVRAMDAQPAPLELAA